MIDRRGFTGTLALLAAAPLRAQTAAFPNKPIRVVPFGTAGGPIDTLTRVSWART